MKIIIFDTEYLSLSKRYSDLRNLIKFKKKLFPEIIQISFLKCSNIYLKNKQKKLNIFIKIKQKIPKRITKLTNITSNILQKKGYCFKESMNLIDKFVDRKSILIANGEDIKLLKLNIRYNNFERCNKTLINYINSVTLQCQIRGGAELLSGVCIFEKSRKRGGCNKRGGLQEKFIFIDNLPGNKTNCHFNIKKTATED